MELIGTLACGNLLGEGIQWDVQDQALWWTDIQKRNLHRYDWSARRLENFAMPERVGSFALIEGRRDLIVAFESGFALYDPEKEETRWLGRPDAALDGVRFNDGRVDRQGRFWAGTMVETQPQDARANLYSVGPDGGIRRHENNITISNGIGWSPDSRYFYFADSPLRTIYVYDFDSATGDIANRRVFAQTPEGAHPDGAAVDSQGFLWSAHWGAGRIVRYAPDGTVDRSFDVPVSQPTCVTFGGPDLDLLFVTSACDGLTGEALAGQPDAGNILVYKVGLAGLAERRFSLNADGCWNAEGRQDAEQARQSR
jgi:sugar lactone lactonase YvrE